MDNWINLMERETDKIGESLGRDLTEEWKRWIQNTKNEEANAKKEIMDILSGFEKDEAQNVGLCLCVVGGVALVVFLVHLEVGIFKLVS